MASIAESGIEDLSILPNTGRDLEKTPTYTPEPPLQLEPGHPKYLFRPLQRDNLDVYSGAPVHWGPDVLVRVPPSKEYPHSFTYFVATEDRRDWFATDPARLDYRRPLHGKPDAWMPIPGLFLLPAWLRHADQSPPAPQMLSACFPHVPDDPRAARCQTATFLPMSSYPRQFARTAAHPSAPR